MLPKYALISVSDKSGVVDFARGLQLLGYGLLSTGGTAKSLRDAGLKVTDVSEYTGFPEMMDGRVKTLHPKVHGGLLGRRDVPEDVAKMQEHGMVDIRVVAVNLYPFRATVLKPGVTVADAVENIDIGGPSMVRSAAKNHAHVAIVTNPADYSAVLDELKAGEVTLATRKRLAATAFSHTAHYDAMVSRYFAETYNLPQHEQDEVAFAAKKLQPLRYGENPHQAGGAFADPLDAHGIGSARQIQGKELSYNNFLDLDAAARMVIDFERPVCVILKHTNPCGAATGDTPAQALATAWEVDPTSAFGSILGFNRTVTADVAQQLGEKFVEVIVAPGFDAGALELLGKKKNLRLLEWKALGDASLARTALFGSYDTKRMSGGWLVQTFDSQLDPENEWKVVTQRQPTADEWAGLHFGWRLVRHVKSNAIIFAAANRALAIGAGQMSRIDSTRIAVSKARSPLQGSAVASDAFFPFRDGLDALADAGATAVIQPGGSVRDDEVIAAANERGIAMVFTGRRHFKHG